MALTYGNNKNKYGQYDFNDYSKVITTIFDIKITKNANTIKC